MLSNVRNNHYDDNNIESSKRPIINEIKRNIDISLFFIDLFFSIQLYYIIYLEG